MIQSRVSVIQSLLSCHVIHYTVHLPWIVGKKICAVHSVVNNDLLIVSWRPPTGFEIGGSLLCAAAIARAASAKLGPRIFWSRTSVLYLKNKTTPWFSCYNNVLCTLNQTKINSLYEYLNEKLMYRGIIFKAFSIINLHY